MDGEKRRKEILESLKKFSDPISGTDLADKYDVSRQVIVQDIALLRAGNYDIISTNRGYILQKHEEPQRIFKVRHTVEQIEEELNLIVDFGGKIEDVFVYHKMYGVIRAKLNIKSRRGVAEYLQTLKSGISTPLMRITDDYHYHTVKAESESILDAIQEELYKKGFLAKLLEYEPVDFWTETST